MIRLLTYFIAFLLFGCGTKAQKSEHSCVYDYENVLTEMDERLLDSIYKLHESKTTNQIALVTTPDLDGKESMLLYDVDFGESHGVGQADKDNGVVIVFSKSLRETRISTGYGT